MIEEGPTSEAHSGETIVMIMMMVEEGSKKLNIQNACACLTTMIMIMVMIHDDRGRPAQVKQ